MFASTFVLANAQTVKAVPVVPNFTQGSMTSVTTQTVTTNETINQMIMRQAGVIQSVATG